MLLLLLRRGWGGAWCLLVLAFKMFLGFSYSFSLSLFGRESSVGMIPAHWATGCAPLSLSCGTCMVISTPRKPTRM